VFIAYLNDERSAYGNNIDHIGQFLDEAKSGQCKIYCSTITLAEVTRHRLVKSQFSSFNTFLADFRSSIIPVDPDPNIMIVAGHLRGMDYTKSGGKRPLATPDAIHIATALALIDTYRVPLDALHTFDRGTNGTDMPIIGYETWCEKCGQDDIVKKVIGLKREPPQHPTPRLMK
jgi:predicted nucleic acid-binding protein